ILLFGVHPATAVGTDLLYAAATKTGGSFVHGLSRSIDWRIVSLLAAGSVPATVLALVTLWLLELNGETVRSLITLVLCFALLLTAAALIFRNAILNYYHGRFASIDPRRTAVATVCVGAVLGILVSISSVGAGAIGVTALVILYPRLKIARIVGSDIAHAVPLTLIAGMGHWIVGTVDWQIVGSLLVGSLPGIFIGSYFAIRVPDTALRLLLASVLILVAGKLAYDNLQNSAAFLTAFTRRAPH